jgi:hypothetical protein
MATLMICLTVTFPDKESGSGSENALLQGKNVKFDIPIRIWIKILESAIELIALYGCEVWGPLSNQEFT